MFKKVFLSRFILISVIAIVVGSSAGQSVFRVGAWCFFHASTPSITWPIYEISPGNWRVKGPHRDKMLNLGLNHMIACANLFGEDALAIMGDSLFSAPSPKNFRSTLTQVENVPNYFPDPVFGNSVWRFSRTAENYPADTSWISHVNVGYNHMYSRNLTRLNGVHSFLTAAEGCIHHSSKIDGINYMNDHTIIDSFLEVGYLAAPTIDPCYQLTTYQMANQLHRVDHFMTGNYVFLTVTPSSGGPFQAALDSIVVALRAASRGIRDNASSVARFWAVLQTQDSPDIPRSNHFRAPTQTELLCSVNLALAHGAKGIDYYLYAPVTAALDDSSEEYGLLDANLNPRQPYYDAQSINTNYQGTGQSLITIGGNFLNLAWKAGYSIHLSQNEPIDSNYKLYDVTSKPPSGNPDLEDSTYVEVGILQNASNVNHYMVVNRRCTASETREVTMYFQSTTNNAYRVTDVFTGCTTTYYPAGNTTFAYTLTLGPGQGKLLKLEDLGAWSGTITSNTTWSCAVVVNGDITVNSGATLTVSPATTVKFASAKKLTINGSLVANSTNPSQRITFTGTTATPGFWNGIIINSGSSTNVSTLRRCDIQCATDGITINYTGATNNVTIDKCKIRYNSYSGIYVNGMGYTGTDPRISNNTISDNGECGIFLTDYAKPAIVINRIENNTASGLYASSYNAARVDSNFIAGNDEFGLWFNYSSSAELNRNTIIYNSGRGVNCFSNSHVSAFGTGNHKGRNLIDSTSGIGIYSSSSSPNFGTDPSLYGNNWIHDNTSYEAQQSGSGQLKAERCYWSGQQSNISGNVDNSPTLGSAPNPVGWPYGNTYDPTLRFNTIDNPIASLPMDDIQLAGAGRESAKMFQDQNISNMAANGMVDLQTAVEEGLKTGDWSTASLLIASLHRELLNARLPDVDFALVNSYANDMRVASFIRKMLALLLVEKDHFEN